MTPRRPGVPCRAPSCPAVIPAGSGGYCERHKKQAHRVDVQARGNKVERGYGGSWGAARATFLRSSPLCFDCGRPAELVHHIRAISDGGERLDFDNMMSLCVPCHGKRHGARGEG